MANAVLVVVGLLKQHRAGLPAEQVSQMPASAGLPADRIVGGALPPKLIREMPTSAILVQPAGGTRPASEAPEFRARIDVRAYHLSLLGADDLSAAAHNILQGQANLVVSGTVVLGVTQTAGPIPFTEPDLPDWHSTLRSYIVLINDQRSGMIRG